MNTAEREQGQPPTWPEIRGELKRHLTVRDATVWQRWFEPVTGIIEQGENNTLTLRLVCPTNFYGNWIRDNYEIFISEVWRQFAPDGKVVFAAQPKTEKERKRQPEPRKTAEVIQLPLWPEDKRGTPNCFLRSALFSSIYGNEERKYLDGVLLAVHGDCSIHYTGKQLAQCDKDFLMAALHLARQHPLGHVCHFRGYSFLKMLGRSDNTDNYAWLDATITRLIATAVKIRIGKRSFEGSLLTSCRKEEGSDIYKLTFDPDFLKLYGVDDWTAVDWETHRRLSRSPLAQWIYDYAVSHVGTKIKLETLQWLSGRAGEPAKLFNKAFRRTKIMLEELAKVSLVVDGEGLVAIDHELSPSQLRYKVKKSPIPRRAELVPKPAELVPKAR
jgi:TrfA protein/DnaA-like protein